MTDHFDEFSKSLVKKSLPRRESLRLLGAALAGALLSPLALKSAWAASPDPCRTFCRCSNKRQQNQCLAACRACYGDTSRLCGSCESGYACTDLASDFYNCGTCGDRCANPGPYEDGACVDGQCFYWCVEGAVDCGETCTDLGTDPDNCGACGNVCGGLTPYCSAGECSACAPGLVLCGDSCADLAGDPDNCGACGNVCPGSAPYCSQGECICPPLPYFALCNGWCVNLLSDNANCGACGNVCPNGFYCSSGACVDPICQFVEC